MPRMPWNSEPVGPHVFVASDLPPAWRGVKLCGHPRCGLPEPNEIHVSAEELYPATPPEQVRVEQRRVGESE